MGIDTGAIYAYPKLTRHPNHGYGYGHSHPGVHPCSSLAIALELTWWECDTSGRAQTDAVGEGDVPIIHTRGMAYPGYIFLYLEPIPIPVLRVWVRVHFLYPRLIPIPVLWVWVNPGYGCGYDR